MQFGADDKTEEQAAAALLAAVDAAGASAVVAARALALSSPSRKEALELALIEAVVEFCETFESWRTATDLPDGGFWPFGGVNTAT